MSLPLDPTPVQLLETRTENSVYSAYESPRPMRRIPNFGHALLFIAFAGMLILLFGTGIALVLGAIPGRGHVSHVHPKLALGAQAVAYLGTLAAAGLFFPLAWHKSFPEGLRWGWHTARTYATALIGGGVALGLVAAMSTYFISPPKDKLGIDQFFTSTSDAWLVTAFGIFLAPVFEEICFRGFLLPALAIAFDWARLPRTAEAREQWSRTTTLTSAAIIFSAILSSALFAMMHFEQDAHLWAVMLVLFCVSLVLTAVRLRLDSVAASAIVHGSYNAFNLVALMIATGGFRHLDKMPH